MWHASCFFFETAFAGPFAFLNEMELPDLKNELPRSRAARYQNEFCFINPDAEHRGILLIKWKKEDKL